MSTQDQIKKLMERDIKLRDEYRFTGDIDLYMEHTQLMERIAELRLAGAR